MGRRAWIVSGGSSGRRRRCQAVQFLVERGAQPVDTLIPKLPEKGRRPVVFDSRLAVVTLVNEHAQRRVRARPDHVPGHFDGKQRVADDLEI